MATLAPSRARRAGGDARARGLRARRIGSGRGPRRPRRRAPGPVRDERQLPRVVELLEAGGGVGVAGERSASRPDRAGPRRARARDRASRIAPRRSARRRGSASHDHAGEAVVQRPGRGTTGSAGPCGSAPAGSRARARAASRATPRRPRGGRRGTSRDPPCRRRHPRRQGRGGVRRSGLGRTFGSRGPEYNAACAFERWLW